MGSFAFLEEAMAELQKAGLCRVPRVLKGQQEPATTFDNQRVVNLSSNNYLGLATHHHLKEKAIQAVEKYGVGSGAVRTIAGTMELHLQLEERLAEFKRTDACLVFQSGFAANAGTVSCILGKEDVIVSDALNHASIIDGCRLSRAQVRIYDHADMDSLERCLQEAVNIGRRVLTVTDGVFSMDGDIAPLPHIVALAKQYGTMLMVDDAHASGVLGENGRGTVDHFQLHGQVDIQVGTISKALGGLGGYVAGPQVLIDYLIQRARPFLFSTSHPPAVTAAALAALDILEQEPQLIDALWASTQFFREGLQTIGLDTGPSQTPIIPVIVGDERKTMELADALFAEGVFAQAIAFPTVPRGKARVRTIITATHTEEQLQYALDCFERIGKRLGIC